MSGSAPRGVPKPTFVELFTPKLVTVLREGYDLARFRTDVVAGLTVAIVALPLSMAIAIASGAPPERGLITAVVGGFLISLLGGSRFQIGGPAGAFIVLIAAVIERHGYDGLMLATFLAGLMLTAIGFLRLGTYIKYIPHPVTVGFTAGIGLIILASQLKDLFGLTLAGAEPAAFLPKLKALWAAGATVNPVTVALALASLAAILILRRIRPTLPGFLIVVATASALTALFGLPVETIGSRFGGIPSSLPAPALPDLSLARVLAVLPDATAIALLGGIESLLSAVVADGMTGRRHRSNCELVAQGIANVATALFGGICATGTIARTATNIRAGAIGPVSGMLHSLFLLAFILIAAPLAAYIPLATLAAILAIVAWNMLERQAIAHILRHSREESVVLLVTLFLTVLVDLTWGIAAGVVLGSFVFMHRMAQIVAVEHGMPEGEAMAGAVFGADMADSAQPRAPYTGPRLGGESDELVLRFSGPLFFGAAATTGAVLERIGRFPALVILDLSAVPFLDSTGAQSLRVFADKAASNGARIAVAGASPAVRRVLIAERLREPEIHYAADVAQARLRA